MKFGKTDVWGFEHAISGMRNPLESWKKSDSISVNCYIECVDCDFSPNIKKNQDVCKTKFHIGQNDLTLAQKLIKAGSEHRKFMRQIFVSVVITAPLYWWKEFDTYKIGTVANSTSTMHKLASTQITMDCFEIGDYQNLSFGFGSAFNLNEHWEGSIQVLEFLREKYLETKDKRYWKELIRLLPESWLQTRTITMNYENILNMVHQRENHKLTEWSIDFINWVKSLPYATELLCIERGEK